MRTLTPEFTALLACLRFYLSTTTKKELTSLLTSDINWTTLLATANKNGLLPVLYQSLKTIEEDLVPPGVMMQLQTYNRMNGLHNFALTKELLKVLEQLEKAGVDAIAFKGAILAASVYGNVTLRQFNDLDILVRQKDFWQAKAVLGTLGYQSSDSKAVQMDSFNRSCQISLSQITPEATMFNQRFETSLLHSNSERSIDLHWGIPPRRMWKRDQFERLWENLDLIDIMGQPIKTFSVETTLVIQCINVAKEPWRQPWKRPLKQICDIAQIIQTHPNLNWQAALQLSSELRNQRLFLTGLSVTRQILGVPLPQFVLEMLLKNQAIDEFLFESDSLDQSFQLPAFIGGIQVLWWEYTYQLKILDQSWDGLLLTKYYLQLILRLLLSPDECDREFFPLPKRLFFLYYIIRPLRVLIKSSPFRKSFVIESKP